MILRNQKILTCDTVLSTGRLYPLKEVKNAVKNFRLEDNRIGGFIDSINEYYHTSESKNIRFCDISHIILKIWVNRKKEVMIDVEILDTPAGLILQQQVTSKEDDVIEFTPLGTGQLCLPIMCLNGNKPKYYVVTDYTIHAVCYKLVDNNLNYDIIK